MMSAAFSYDRPYAGGGFSVAKNGAVAFTVSPVDRPTDVAVSTGGAARQLTHLNELNLGGKRLATLQTLNVRAPDGGNVPSWLLLPPTYQAGQRVPMILEIHGGPYSSYGPHFATDYQLYAAAGYAVLFTNPRGSTGYGQAFADGIDKTYPDSDFTDLMAAVDAAVASGVADPNNLFVTGGSGGGILTAWIVGKTDRFKAAAAQKPVINWTSMALTADGVPFFARYWMGSMPWENYQSYWARSPLSLVANVKTPTLVVVGSEDYRTPDQRSRAILRCAEAQGRADDVREGARGKPRRHRLPAQPIGGEGGCDHRLVRPVPGQGRAAGRLERRHFHSLSSLTNGQSIRFATCGESAARRMHVLGERQ